MAKVYFGKDKTLKVDGGDPKGGTLKLTYKKDGIAYVNTYSYDENGNTKPLDRKKADTPG